MWPRCAAATRRFRTWDCAHGPRCNKHVHPAAVRCDMVLHQAFRARHVRKTGIGGEVRRGVKSGVSRTEDTVHLMLSFETMQTRCATYYGMARRTITVHSVAWLGMAGHGAAQSSAEQRRAAQSSAEQSSAAQQGALRLFPFGVLLHPMSRRMCFSTSSERLNFIFPGTLQ